MTGYYEIKDFTIETKDGIIEKKMIVFYDLGGRELTKEIYIEGKCNISFDENNQLKFGRVYEKLITQCFIK